MLLITIKLNYSTTSPPKINVRAWNIYHLREVLCVSKWNGSYLGSRIISEFKSTPWLRLLCLLMIFSRCVFLNLALPDGAGGLSLQRHPNEPVFNFFVWRSRLFPQVLFYVFPTQVLLPCFDWCGDTLSIVIAFSSNYHGRRRLKDK